VNALQRSVQRVAASRPGGGLFRVTRVDAQDRLVQSLSGGRRGTGPRRPAGRHLPSFELTPAGGS
jgi:hypothetical protein